MSMMLTSLAEKLSDALLGRPVTVEYPGFISMPYAGADAPERGETFWAIGNSNGYWSGDAQVDGGEYVLKGFSIVGSEGWEHRQPADLVDRLAANILQSENER